LGAIQIERRALTGFTSFDPPARPGSQNQIPLPIEHRLKIFHVQQGFPLNMASSNFDEPIENIQKSLQSVSRDILHDEKARKKLLGITMQSMTMLETPLETIWRMIMSVRSVPMPSDALDEALLMLSPP